MIEPDEAAVQAVLDNEAELDEIAETVAVDPVILQSMNNPRDRMLLLKLDAELGRFLENKTALRLEFPPMSSYHRLLVHRVAHYFRLDHKVDGTGKKVVLFKTEESKIPVLRVSDLREQEDAPVMPKFQIMHRKQEKGPDASPAAVALSAAQQDIITEEKKLEERHEAYAKARARIFQDHPEMSPAELKAVEDSFKIQSHLVQDYEQEQYAEETANELFGLDSTLPDVFSTSMSMYDQGGQRAYSHFFPQAGMYDEAQDAAVPVFPPPMPYYSDIPGSDYVYSVPSAAVVQPPRQPPNGRGGDTPSSNASWNPTDDEQWPVLQKHTMKPAPKGVPQGPANPNPNPAGTYDMVTQVSGRVPPGFLNPSASSFQPPPLPVSVPAPAPAPAHATQSLLPPPTTAPLKQWTSNEAPQLPLPLQPYGGAFAAPTLLPYVPHPYPPSVPSTVPSIAPSTVAVAPSVTPSQASSQLQQQPAKPTRHEQGHGKHSRGAYGSRRPSQPAQQASGFWHAEAAYNWTTAQQQQQQQPVYDVHRRNQPRSRTLFDPYQKSPPKKQQKEAPAFVPPKPSQPLAFVPPSTERQVVDFVAPDQAEHVPQVVDIAPAAVDRDDEDSLQVPMDGSHQLMFDYSMAGFDRAYTRSDADAPLVPNHIMQVCGLETMSRRESDKLLGEIRRKGAKIKWLNKQTVIAIFKNAKKAEQACHAVSKSKLTLKAFSPVILKRPASEGSVLAQSADDVPEQPQADAEVKE